MTQMSSACIVVIVPTVYNCIVVRNLPKAGEAGMHGPSAAVQIVDRLPDLRTELNLVSIASFLSTEQKMSQQLWYVDSMMCVDVLRCSAGGSCCRSYGQRH